MKNKNNKNPLNKSVNSQQQNLRKKGGKANFKRYESNSVDEEEFQDYFINPVKRKEFDMRRKRQQVKEMHNVSSLFANQQLCSRSPNSRSATSALRTRRP